MKIISNHADGSRQSTGSRSGYTLVEMLFVVAILIILVLALFAAQLIGFRLGQLVDSKSGASDSSRRTLQQLPVDIRSAKMWQIGDLLSGTNFVAITNGLLQGRALQLCQTSVGTQYTIYYFTNVAANDGVLMRMSTANWNPVIICSNLLDNLFFTAEDYAGNPKNISIANVNSYKNIIHVKLDFCQFQYPLTQVGTNGLYDYYKLEFRVTPHLPE